MTRLHDALDDIAARAPEVQVRRGLYRSARRRRRVTVVLSVVAVIAVVALVAPFTRLSGRTSSEFGGGGSAGIPGRVSMPPWWTSSGPAGPASVVFSGDVPQSDYEDYDLAWWRSGYTAFPSVVVGLNSDTYRVVRDGYAVGTELSPDGRYLLVQDRRVLDLSTGKARQLLPSKPESPVSGAWSADGTRILYVEDRVTTVLAWPSLRVEARFRHPDQVPADQDVALSPDGSLLAVHSNQMLSVYRADGTRVWTVAEQDEPNLRYPELGQFRIAGRAAWHADGRLAVFVRTETMCSTSCPDREGTWKLMFVDLNGGNATLLAGPSYPLLEKVYDARIVAWRGEDAYAVVIWFRGWDQPDRVGLIRLRPGEGAFDWVLKAPDGATWMQVATDYVDVARPTGDPVYGFNARELAGQVASGACCFVPIVVLVILFVRWRRRYRAVKLFRETLTVKAI